MQLQGYFLKIIKRIDSDNLMVCSIISKKINNTFAQTSCGLLKVVGGGLLYASLELSSFNRSV